MCISEDVSSAVLRVSPGGRNNVYGRVFIAGGGLAAAKFVLIKPVQLFKKRWVGWLAVYSLILCEELEE